MKKLITLILLVFSTLLAAQEYVDGKITYSGSISIDKDKEQVKNLVREYVALSRARGMKIELESEDKIFVSSSFETKIRKYVFPFFTNTKEYQCLFIQKIIFTEQGLDYQYTNFYITRDRGYSTSSVNIIDGYSVGSATHKGKELNPLEKYDTPRFRKPFALLFSDIDKKMGLEIELFKQHIK